MKFYCEDKETVLHELGSEEGGITSAEAEKRLAANGKNRLPFKSVIIYGYRDA